MVSVSGIKLYILARTSLSSERTTPGDEMDPGSSVPAASGLGSSHVTRRDPPLGKVTPLAETDTFSHFPTRIPNESTYRWLFLKRQRAWSRSWCSCKHACISPPKWTRGSLSSSSSSGRGAKKDGCFWWLFECFLSWLLTTGVNKGSLWERRSVPSVSDVFMPGWGNWMAAECSHAGPSHPNQRLFF